MSCSRSSYPDPRDANDPDYRLEDEPTVTVTKYLKGILPKTVTAVARADVGTATLARTMTALCDDLYDAGYLKEQITVTQSKLESQKSIDGKKRLEDLAFLIVKGMFEREQLKKIHRNLLYFCSSST